MKLTIVGLGNESGDISVNGLNAIKLADIVVLKSEKTASATFLQQNDIKYISLDNLYEENSNFDELNKNIADKLISLAKTYKKIIFCVDGCGSDDGSIPYIKNNFQVEIISGVNSSEKILNTYPQTSCQNLSGYQFLDVQNFSTQIPLIIREIDSDLLAGNIKLKLADYYDEEMQVVVFTNNKISEIKLYMLDRLKHFDYSTTLLINPIKLTDRKRFNVYDIVEILDVLRGENGCPWDKAQTHLSIRGNCIEEAYELVDAVDNGIVDDIMEECGDVMLQALLNIKIATDDNEFNLNDCATNLCNKLITRHSHIFGTDKVANEDDALKVWEKNKNIEKNKSTITETLIAVPDSFASLLKCYKILKRAKKSGLNFKNEKLIDLAEKLQSANNNSKQVELENILGDLLMAICDICVKQEINPEVILNKKCKMFVSKFENFEKAILQSGESIKNLSETTLSKYWSDVEIAND